MASKEYPLEPVEVPHVLSANRCIRTPIPVPESLPLLERMRECEPRSMRGQAPILWHRGDGFHIYDRYGNRWLDFSSGVLVTSSGHGHPHITEALVRAAQAGIHHAYCFPSEARARLVAKIVGLAPQPLAKVFLLTTGAEAVECCIKLARTHGRRTGGSGKRTIITFENGFHGRTMGAVTFTASKPLYHRNFYPLMSGVVHVPYPDPYRPILSAKPGEDYGEAVVRYIEEQVLGHLVPADNVDHQK